ncbi:hypothetical protein BKA93DRAFT_746160 [Sparassis latifolia]
MRKAGDVMHSKIKDSVPGVHTVLEQSAARWSVLVSRSSKQVRQPVRGSTVISQRGNARRYNKNLRSTDLYASASPNMQRMHDSNFVYKGEHLKLQLLPRPIWALFGEYTAQILSKAERCLPQSEMAAGEGKARKCSPPSVAVIVVAAAEGLV